MVPFEEKPLVPAGSVTEWIGQAKAGDHTAARKIWERYFKWLIRLARQKLRGTSRRVADEEDVAVDAFVRFWQGAARGQFSQLHNRDDLRRLLAVITRCQAIDHLRYQGRQKRDGVVEDEWAWFDPEAAADKPSPQRIAAREPPPAFWTQVHDAFDQLLQALGNDDLRAIAWWKVEGYTNEEIAAKLACVPRTVERRLQLIRRLLAQEIMP